MEFQLPGFDNAKLEELEKFILTAENPFLSTDVKSVWTSVPDVPSINRRVRQIILRSIEDCRRLNEPRIILVKGEAGLGKTHILSWLRQQSQERWNNNKEHFYFALVPTLRGITNPYLHLLKEIANSLGNPARKAPGQEYTPLEEMLSDIVDNLLMFLYEEYKKESQSVGKEASKDICEQLESYRESKRTNRFLALQKIVKSGILSRCETDALIWLKKMKKYQEIDDQFLRVLFKYPDERYRNLVLSWLSGIELEDEKAAILGKVPNPISTREDAYRILVSLLMISEEPILLTFDQIEGVYDQFGDKGVKILFDTIMTLYGEHPKKVCFLIMCQTAVWDIFRNMVSKPALDRINREENLVSITPEEAVELVRIRMEQVWKGKEIPYPTYPFSKTYIHEVVKKEGKRNPRQLLKWFDSVFEQIQLEGRIPVAISASTEEETKLINSLVELAATAAELGRIEVGDSAEEIIKRAKIYTENFLKDDSTHPVQIRQETVKNVLIEFLKHFSEKNIEIRGAKVLSVWDLSTAQSSRSAFEFNAHVKNKNGEIVEKKVEIEINNGKSGRTLLTNAEKLRKSAFEGSVDYAFMLRDASLHLGEDTKTNAVLEEIRNRAKGGLIYIDKDSTAEIVSWECLLNGASAGDIISNSKPVKREEVLEHLANRSFAKNRIIWRIFSEITETNPERRLEDSELRMYRLLQEQPVIAVWSAAKRLDISVSEALRIASVLEAKGLATIKKDVSNEEVILLKPDALN